MIKRALPAIMSLFLVSAALGQDYEIGIESSMKKVYIRNDVDSFTGEFRKNTTVNLALNEYESFQVVVKANKALSGVRVTAEGFGALEVEVAPVGYVEVTDPTEGFGSDMIGWHPDPILIFTDRVDIASGDYQPFWVTIYAPKNADPGEVNGTLRVRADNGATESIQVRTSVWDFTLPDKPSMPTAMAWQGEDHVRKIYENTASWDERVQDGQRYILKEEYLYLIDKYRMFPDRIYGHGLDFLTSIFNERGWIDFSNLVNGPIHLEENGGQYYIKGTSQTVQSFMDEYLDRLKLELNYIPSQMKPSIYTYVLDEEPNDFLEVAKEQVLRRIKNEVPGVKVVLDSWQHEVIFQKDNELEDLFDVLVHWMFFSETAIQRHMAAQERLRPKGKKIWWYVTTTSPNEVNIHLESDPISTRLLLGMTSAKFRSDGFLYWEIAMWTNTGFNDHPVTITQGGYTDWNPRARGRKWNGDAALILPGPTRIIPTQRLANFRDGMEDFEYYAILRQLKDISTDQTLVQEAERLLEVGDNVVGSAPIFHTYIPDLVYAERKRVGDLIVALKDGIPYVYNQGDNTPPDRVRGVRVQ